MSAQGIVQYILVRSDLCKTLGWPVGALVAQACHASTAAIHMFYDHEDTKKYLSDLDNMHKIILSVSIILKPSTRKNPINYCFDGISLPKFLIMEYFLQRNIPTGQLLFMS